MTQSFPLAWPDGWPRINPDHRKNTSPFQTTFDRARRQLMREIELLGGSQIVVSSHLPIRKDGNPYADQARRRIEDPGVAVYFLLRGRPMAMARDAYWTVHDNLRSIGLAVEALRALERHGGGNMMERAFEGFAALQGPNTKKTWRHVLGFMPAAIPTLKEAEAHYRERVRRAHPDVADDGSHMDIASLNVAIKEARAELKGPAS